MSASEQILLTGAGGMLARAWIELLTSRGLRFRAAGRADLDVTDAASVAAALTPDVRTVINCAAYTKVDQAEKEPEAALAVNGTGAGRLADRCRQTGAVLVHYSTDYVFPGTTTPAYRVDDPCDPVNEYGLSKLAGERRIRESGAQHLIVRTSWLYAPWSKNFVRTIAGLARTRTTLRVVDDQTGRPTSSEPLAAATLALLAADARGTYHVCDSGHCTWYEFAREIAAYVNPACRVDPCGTKDYPLPARRPPCSVLDLSRTEQLIGPAHHWKVNLADVLKRME